MDEFMSLTQEGRVDEYCDEFKFLLSKIRIPEEISEDYAVYCFIFGLTPGIGDMLMAYHNLEKGLSLEMAMYMARLQEGIPNAVSVHGSIKGGSSDLEVSTYPHQISSPRILSDIKRVLESPYFSQFTKVESAHQVFEEMPKRVRNDIQESINHEYVSENTNQIRERSIEYENGKENEELVMNEESQEKDIDDSTESEKNISRTRNEMGCLNQDLSIDFGSTEILPSQIHQNKDLLILNSDRPGNQMNVFLKVVDSKPGVTKLGWLLVCWDTLDDMLEKVINENFEVEQVLIDSKDIIQLDYKDRLEGFQAHLLMVLEHMWHRWKSKMMFLIVSKNGCTELGKYDFKNRNNKLKFKLWWVKNGLKNRNGHMWYKWKPKRLFSIMFLDGCGAKRGEKGYMCHRWEAKLMFLIVIKGYCYTDIDIELIWCDCNKKEQGVSRREDAGTIKQYICLSCQPSKWSKFLVYNSAALDPRTDALLKKTKYMANSDAGIKDFSAIKVGVIENPPLLDYQENMEVKNITKLAFQRVKVLLLKDMPSGKTIKGSSEKLELSALVEMQGKSTYGIDYKVTLKNGEVDFKKIPEVLAQAVCSKDKSKYLKELVSESRLWKIYWAERGLLEDVLHDYMQWKHTTFYTLNNVESLLNALAVKDEILFDIISAFRDHVPQLEFLIEKELSFHFNSIVLPKLQETCAFFNCYFIALNFHAIVPTFKEVEFLLGDVKCHHVTHAYHSECISLVGGFIWLKQAVENFGSCNVKRFNFSDDEEALRQSEMISVSLPLFVYQLMDATKRPDVWVDKPNAIFSYNTGDQSWSLLLQLEHSCNTIASSCKDHNMVLFEEQMIIEWKHKAFNDTHIIQNRSREVLKMLQDARGLTTLLGWRHKSAISGLEVFQYATEPLKVSSNDKYGLQWMIDQILFSQFGFDTFD